jgi:hypothetical protein
LFPQSHVCVSHSYFNIGLTTIFYNFKYVLQDIILWKYLKFFHLLLPFIL